MSHNVYIKLDSKRITSTQKEIILSKFFVQLSDAKYTTRERVTP